MKCILLKASNSKYINLIDVDSISLLVHKFGAVIVDYNDNFKDAHVFMDYYGLDEKKAKQCAETEIQVMIYDDYKERHKPPTNGITTPRESGLVWER